MSSFQFVSLTVQNDFFLTLNSLAAISLMLAMMRSTLQCVCFGNIDSNDSLHSCLLGNRCRQRVFALYKWTQSAPARFSNTGVQNWQQKYRLVFPRIKRLSHANKLLPTNLINCYSPIKCRPAVLLLTIQSLFGHSDWISQSHPMCGVVNARLRIVISLSISKILLVFKK